MKKKPDANDGGRPRKEALSVHTRPAADYRAGSVTFQGRPYLPSSARKGSGSICSMFHTPGLFHLPVTIIMAPTMAGRPVV